MAINYSFYGSTISGDFNDSNVFKIYIAEFKPSSWLTVDMWTDSSVNFIVNKDVANSDDRIRYSDITNSLGKATDISSYPRCNIIHRTADFGYVYDGDYFTWLANTFGGEYKTLSMYVEHYNMYTIDMEQQMSNFTREDIKGIYLLGYMPENGTPVIRPIFKVSDVRYIIAPILPAGLLDHWHMTKEYTEKVNGGTITVNPTDNYGVTGWNNTFNIMRCIPDKESFDMLVNYSNQDDVLTNWEELLFFTPNQSATVEGYLGTSTGATAYAEEVKVQYKFLNGITKLGSTLHKYKKDGNNKYFVTGSVGIDGNTTYSNLPPSTNSIKIQRKGNSLNISWPDSLHYNDVLSHLKMTTVVNGVTRTYTYTGSLGNTDHGGGEYEALGLWIDNVWILCIPQGNGVPADVSGFYLLGHISKGIPGTRVQSNFMIIDKLDSLHLEGIFDNFEPHERETEKYTENLIEDELGGELGTGEIIDVENINGTINTHDGTMGNGTGSVHEGDTTIPDPEDDLPIAGGEGSVLGSGFIKVYTPTKIQLDDFTSELLSDNVVDVLKDYFTTNPMEGIIGMSMLPYTGFSSNTQGKPKIGTYKFNTELDIAGKEYLTVDYGTIDIKFSYDGYENYSQYSDCKIFLPHIGYKEIDIDMVQGCRIHLKYLVSLVTGDIYAYLYAKWVSGQDKGANNLDHLLYHWQGNCNMTVPVTHIDKSSYVNGAIQAAGSIASIVSSGMTMGALGGAMAGATTAGEMSALNKQYESAGYNVGRGISNTASNIASMFKPSVTTSGNISGACAFMGERRPYLLLSRPIITGTEDIKRHYGLVTCKKYNINELKNTGYTELNGVDLNGVTATEDELNELKSILEGGFYA